MKAKEKANKATMLKAMHTSFNKPDYAAAEKCRSPKYIQHSALVGPGRAGVFDTVKRLPATVKMECGLIMAEGDFVMAHVRYSGHGLATPWIAVEIVPIKNGVFVEHWDVIQSEVTKKQSKSGRRMFGISLQGAKASRGSRAKTQPTTEALT